MLRAIGYGARAARLLRCPPTWNPTVPPCGDRLCRRCGRRWVRRHLEKLRARVADMEEPIMVWATLKTIGSSARSACERHRKTFERFVRRARRHQWIIVGARHLVRGERGAWNRHDHLVVIGHGDRATLAAAVGAAGASWVDPSPIRSVDAMLGYAVAGALELPGAGLADWIQAMRGARLVIVLGLRARDTEKRKISPVNPHDTPGHAAERDARLRSRIREVLAGGPMAEGRIRRRVTPASRAALPATLAAMVDAGELARVPGVRGMLWAPAVARLREREGGAHV